METDHYRILEKPLITEKSTMMQEQGNRVMFQVKRSANKMQIKDAVQGIFNVTVLDVNTINVKPKTRRFGK
ncbi:MAG: 50S ribosomal protein L23, partial [Nitrospinae bacterium]|nr:50S ribosomal protein L23 [Nitrospinota bacterium]